MRQRLGSIAWTLAIVTGALPALGQVKGKAGDVAGEKFVELGGNLLVEPPVGIHDTPSDEVHETSAGDLVLLQIRYSIVPPMPASVAVTPKAGHMELISASTTAREVGPLERQPRAGGQIGVGFVQVFLRAASAGKDQLTVRVKLADGSVKSLPFAFNVKPRK